MKLIVLEAADGLGKSTQTKILAERLGYKIFIQPSGENVVGFLREEVKNNPKYLAFERQLLHTISHVCDAYTEFNLVESNERVPFILDRCHASAYIYGEVQKMRPEFNDLILKIHQKVYADVFKNYDIRIIFLNRDTPFKDEKTDEFEKAFEWLDVKVRYDAFYKRLESKELFLFHPQEKTYQLNITPLSKEEITEKLLELIG